jgi:hypothetical protein
MDDQLIEKLISSDELIVSTIEENSQSLNILIDQFSSIMSMTTVDGEKLEKQIQEQGEKEAEFIKGTLTESVNQSSNLSLEQVAEAEVTASESSLLSDQTVNSLIDVISNMQNVLEKLDIGGIETQTPQMTEINTGNLTQVIDDFKTLSNLNWCTDWLKCLEKIVEQADVVKDALDSIPSDKKLSLGINEEELQKVDQSIQKVKEDLSADINLNVAKTEMIEQETAAAPTSQLSPAFLNSFSELSERLSSFTEKIENNSVSQESFLNKVNEFSETTSKSIENTFTVFSDTTKTLVEKPSTLEIPAETTVTTEAKPEFGGFNFEEFLFPPQFPVQFPPLQTQAPLPPPPAMLQIGGETGGLPMVPPIEVNVTKNIVPLETTQVAEGLLGTQEPIANQNVTQPQVVVAPTPPPAIVGPEMVEMGGFVNMPMPPLAQNVETTQAPNVPLPPPLINFEDLFPKRFEMEPEVIPTNINTEEKSALDFGNFFNFATNPIESSIINDNESIVSSMQAPISFEQLNMPMPPLFERNVEAGPQMGVAASPEVFNMGLGNLISPPVENVTNQTIVQNNQNLPLPNLNPFEGFMQNEAIGSPVGNLGVESAPQQSQNLSANIEELLIKNQEIPQVNLGTAISKIESDMGQPTSQLAASTEVMMNEVNLEPLSNQLSSSISSLGENIKSTPTAVEQKPATSETESSSNVMGEILSMLTKLDATLGTLSSSQGRGGAMPSLGGSLSDSQARLIGRQIANELKDSFSKLYN